MKKKISEEAWSAHNKGRGRETAARQHTHTRTRTFDVICSPVAPSVDATEQTQKKGKETKNIGNRSHRYISPHCAAVETRASVWSRSL